MPSQIPVSETEETVAQLLASQNVVPAWMHDAVKNLKPTDTVLIGRYRLPFGSYVVSVKAVSR
jgi:hypothetical protein